MTYIRKHRYHIKKQWGNTSVGQTIDISDANVTTVGECHQGGIKPAKVVRGLRFPAMGT